MAVGQQAVADKQNLRTNLGSPQPRVAVVPLGGFTPVLVQCIENLLAVDVAVVPPEGFIPILSPPRPVPAACV